MIKLLNLFRNNKQKLERLESLHNDLLQLQAEKDLLLDNYQMIYKAVNSDEFTCKEEISHNPLTGDGYIRAMAGFKLKERKLNKEIEFLKSLNSVSKALDFENKAKAIDLVKSAYKQGKIGLDTYNKVVGSKTKKGQTKYADVMVLNTNGELLLLKRSIWEDAHKGAWVIPGGHVDEGEDDASAAARELYEESGISVDKLKEKDQLVTIGWSKVGVYEDDKAHISYYLLSGVDTKDFEIVLDEAESRDYLWVKREEINNYPMVFNMADNVKHLLGWDETPNVTIIKKAVLEGIIPIEKVPDIVKAMNHKYIRKEPDGKGGWTYIYEEEKNKLSQVQIETIQEYCEFDYEKINSELRMPVGDEDLEVKANKLSAALSKLPGYKGEVIRFQPLNKDIKIGDVVTFKAFTSTSKKLDLSKKKSGDKVFKISSINGKDISEISSRPEENEVLFDKGTKFKLNRIEGDTYYFEESNETTIADEVGREDIHKSYLQDDITDEEYEQEIEKGAKNKSKLKKVKKLVYSAGKYFLRTYWVNEDGDIDPDKDSIFTEVDYDYMKNDSLKGLVGNLKITDKIVVTTKIKTTEGELVDIFFDKTSQDWYLLVSSGGKIVWCKFSALKEVVKVEGEGLISGGEYKFLKNLGGSTGAKLVEKDGKKYVAKKGASIEHIANEYTALRIYDELGVKVAKIHDFIGETLYTEYIEGSHLADLPINDFVRKNIAKGFVVDCIMGNWDVVGMGLDNIMFNNEDKDFYRIDVGGSMKYRAQGAEKDYLDWNEEVKEIDTLRDPNINPNTAKFFGHLTDQDIYDQLSLIRDKVTVDSMVNKRIMWLAKEMDKRLGKTPIKEPNTLTEYDEPLFNVNPLLGEDIIGVYDKINEFMKVTQEDIDFIDSSFPVQIRRSVDQELAKNAANKYFDQNVVKDLLGIGLSYCEILTINDYTGSDYSYYNQALVESTNALLGNIAFENLKISDNGINDSQGSEHEVGNFHNTINDFYDKMIAVAKTINYHHHNNDTDYNTVKVEEFRKMMVHLSELNDKLIIPGKFTDSERAHINYLYNKSIEILSAIDKPDKKIEEIKKQTVPVSKKEKSELELFKEFSNYERKGWFIASKVLLKGLTKMERSGNPKFAKMGQTVRKIKVYGDAEEKFKKQHKFGNFVIHQRASSSSKEEKTNWSGNFELTVLGGIGADVSSISQHESEQEVLHRPFSLFYCGSSSEQSGVNKVLMTKYV